MNTQTERIKRLKPIFHNYRFVFYHYCSILNNTFNTFNRKLQYFYKTYIIIYFIQYMFVIIKITYITILNINIVRNDLVVLNIGHINSKI